MAFTVLDIRVSLDRIAVFKGLQAGLQTIGMAADWAVFDVFLCLSATWIGIRINQLPTVGAQILARHVQLMGPRSGLCNL